jgi:hypothetical protein
MKKCLILSLFLCTSIHQLVPAPQTTQKRAVHRGKTRRTPVSRYSPALNEHFKIQQEFKALRENLGLPTHHNTIRSIRRIHGSQATQAEFNSIRSALNELLSKEILTDMDINQIEQKIAELKAANPARWPRAQDYQEVLNLRK